MALQSLQSVRSDAVRNAGPSTQSTLDLVRRLTDDIRALFRQEVALATAEISGAISNLMRGASSIALAAALLFGGYLVLLAAVVLGLAEFLPPWVAALIVGFALSAIGYSLLRSGQTKLESVELKPHHVAKSLRRDKDVLTRKEP
jgi:ABC-type multidrug transport system fused ATPase/permease subunit